MYHLFWTAGPAPAPWRHEVFEDPQVMAKRQAALLPASEVEMAAVRMRVFHFPEAMEPQLDLPLMLTWLDTFARHEMPFAGSTECSADGAVQAPGPLDSPRAVVRVGAESWQLNGADSIWLVAAISDVIHAPASEEFLQLTPPDAVIVAVVNGVETEFELYDGWTTLADLVSGHWHFPAGIALRDIIESRHRAMIPDGTGAD